MCLQSVRAAFKFGTWALNEWFLAMRSRHNKRAKDQGFSPHWAYTLLILVLAACVPTSEMGESAGAALHERDQSLVCGATRSSFRFTIVNGTSSPVSVPLRLGSKLAIGRLERAGGVGVCTVTALNGAWGLTANHCIYPTNRPALAPADLFARFSGRDDGDFTQGQHVRVPIRQVISAEELKVAARVPGNMATDIALVRFGDDPTEKLPLMLPLELTRYALPALRASVEGTMLVEAAGYGVTAAGSTSMSERRLFVNLALTRVGNHTLNTSGNDQQGVCNGDSGGPLLFYEGDRTRIIAALWRGTAPRELENCRQTDEWSRIDILRHAIEGFTGPTGVPGPLGCGEDFEGGCVDREHAFQCDATGERSIIDCGATGRVCGYNADVRRFACVAEAEDACQGLSRQGACGGATGQVATWCDPSAAVPIRTRDCAECGQSCGHVRRYGGVYCRSSACGELTATGQCDGQVLRFCEEGEAFDIDCAARGQVCVRRPDRFICADRA